MAGICISLACRIRCVQRPNRPRVVSPIPRTVKGKSALDEPGDWQRLACIGWAAGLCRWTVGAAQYRGQCPKRHGRQRGRADETHFVESGPSSLSRANSGRPGQPTGIALRSSPATGRWAVAAALTVAAPCQGAPPGDGSLYVPQR